MNLTQFSVACGCEPKWLLNSSALLGRSLRPTPENARWWGLVRALESTFGLTLANASAAATRALAGEIDDANVVVAEDDSGVATMSVNLFRYDTNFLANLSRARVRETPKRRGRRAEKSRDPIAAAEGYGLDIGLILSSLARTPAERLALLDRNRGFLYQMRESRRRG
ncbi:MAG: hypothetical protein M3Z17_00535 [Gemmatimonadota bacterium]|nr:hypothetical protein [Gemmatimonadota bacterium]